MEKKRTMKAMVLEAFNTPLVLKELPVPTPAANEVLIRLMADGVCYTDVKIQKGLMPTAKLPLVMGHEIAGIVEEVGSEVKELKVGDKVAAFTYDVCGECHYCRRGIPALCENVRGMAGCTRNGGYEEYMTWPESALVKIPEGIPFEIAAVTTDAVTTCYHALCERVSVKEGDTVLIMGVGGLGINAIQIAKALGRHRYRRRQEREKAGNGKKLRCGLCFQHHGGESAGGVQKTDWRQRSGHLCRLCRKQSRQPNWLSPVWLPVVCRCSPATVPERSLKWTICIFLSASALSSHQEPPRKRLLRVL